MCNTQSAPVFGVALKVLCKRASVEVPTILGDLLRWMATRALSTPDVFANPAKSCATSQLKGAIDSGASVSELLDAAHPAVVGSVLKLWLQDLPDPLLSWDEQVELLSACKDEGSIEQRIASLNDGLAMVDHFTLGTLKPLLLFLQQYCFRQRRFDQQLLQVAVAMAPILFPAALAAGTPELRLAEETVATLVSNALHVFNPALAANVPVVTPQALCEAAAEMQQQDCQQQQEVAAAAAALAAEQEFLQEEHAAAAPSRHHHHYVHHHIPNLYNNVEQHFAHNSNSSNNAARHAPPQSLAAIGEDDDSYEPYMHDVTFLAAFDTMVYGCVTDALFGPDSYDDDAISAAGSPMAYETAAAAWAAAVAAEDDCCAASMASSWSHSQLRSSGGGASAASSRTVSAGGASFSSSIMVAAGTGVGSMCYSPLGDAGGGGGVSAGGAPAAHYAHRPALHIVRPNATHHGDMPYSPNAMLVPQPALSSPGSPDIVAVADGLHRVASAPTVTGAAAAATKASASMGSAAAAAELAELAHRELNSGSVFCVISAQPGGSAAKAKQMQMHSPAPTQLQLEMLEYLQEQEALLGSPAPMTPRRPTEGGAGSPFGSAPHHGANAAVARALSRLPLTSAAAGNVESMPANRQRRMTMGGDQLAHQPQLQGAVRSPGPSSGGGAPMSPYHVQLPLQYSVQIPRRQTMGGRRSSGGGSSGGGSRTSSGGGAAAGNHDDAGAAATVAMAARVVELGVAGHLAVTLNTADQTLAVRDVATAEAAVHRVPIRSLTPAQQQQEKERLKRQLKDVSHAFEALAGRPLTPALKEPLRPVYVRYHKIKALLGGSAGSRKAEGAVNAKAAATDGGAGTCISQGPMTASKMLLSSPPAAMMV